MKRQTLVLVFVQLAAVVFGHGWLSVPEPRGFAGDNQGSASTQGPCGPGGNFSAAIQMTNYGTLTVTWTIGGGHTGTAGPNTCRFAVSDTMTANSFDSNVVASGFNCNAGTYTKNITVFSENSGTTYLQFFWFAGDGSKWYNCAMLDIAPGNFTVTPLISGVPEVHNVVSGGIDFYKIPITSNQHLYIVASGPTDTAASIQLLAKSGGIASPASYDTTITIPSGATLASSICAGTANTTGFITVLNNEASTGTYTFFAAEYYATIDYRIAPPQIMDQLPYGGSKVYYTQAYSTNEVPKRIVLTAVPGASLSISTRCEQLDTPNKVVSDGQTSTCVDLTANQGRKYILVTMPTPGPVQVAAEPGTCAERESSGFRMGVSFALVLVALLFSMF